MLTFRITSTRYIEDLSGYGAWKNGGRWNSPSKYMLYTSQSLALAAWEVFVNIPAPFIPSQLSSVSLFIPDDIIVKTLNLDDLPSNWQNTPYPPELRQIGDTWIDSKNTLVLKVPSSVIPSEFNFLINPKHSDFHKVKIITIQPFEFDARAL